MDLWFLALKRVAINGKGPNSKYTEPYSRFNLHKQATVNQHHMLRSKMATVLRDPPEEELIITIPKSVKIDQLVSSLRHSC